MHDRALGVVVNGVGLIADEQHHGATRGQRGQRLVGGIEEQDAAFEPVVGGCGQWGRRGVGAMMIAVRPGMMIGQQVQRSSPRPTVVDVGGLELSVRPRLL